MNGLLRSPQHVRLLSLPVLRSQSDERLVSLARAGNELAFEAIVERYRRPLLRHAQRVLSEGAAEDALQQALLAAWSALRRGDDVRDLGPWLHRILHNAALNVLRGARRGEHAELSDALPGGMSADEALEARLAVRRALSDMAALPERQREAMLAVAVHGRSQEEVARTLGLSHGAVGQLVLRGRRALRAAATALTPPWAIDWLARAGGEAPSAATVSKLVAVVAVAGTAAGTPALVHRDASPDRPQALADVRTAPERTAPRRAERRADRARAVTPPAATLAPAAAQDDADHSGPGRAGSGDRSGSGRSGSGGSGHGGGGSGGPGPSAPAVPAPAAPAPEPAPAPAPRDDGEDHSGSGRSGSGDHSGSSGSGSSGSGSSGSGGGDSSGPGSGEEAVAVAPAPALTPTPVPAPVVEEDSSGPGSGGADDDHSGPGSGGGDDLD